VRLRTDGTSALGHTARSSDARFVPWYGMTDVAWQLVVAGTVALRGVLEGDIRSIQKLISGGIRHCTKTVKDDARAV